MEKRLKPFSYVVKITQNLKVEIAWEASLVPSTREAHSVHGKQCGTQYRFDIVSMVTNPPTECFKVEDGHCSHIHAYSDSEQEPGL